MEIEDVQDKFNEILTELSKNTRECIVDLPNFRKVKAEIIQIDFKNIVWRPIQVHFLDGLEREENVREYGHPTFGYEMEDEGIIVKRKVPYTEDWVHPDWITFK